MESPPIARRLALEELVGRIRPKLHAYCARMTGSVIDGEDVLQDALLKAFSAIERGEAVKNLESWLFRIAHNTALDFLRGRARRDAILADADLEKIVDPASPLEARELVATSLRTFMRLPAVQRSSVILMDVLGYSLDEIAEVMNASLKAVKSALHRGRFRLRELAKEPDDGAPVALDARRQALLAAYVDRFNARDFDAVRRMLAEEVQLEVVSKARMRGPREAVHYFTNYSNVFDWRLRAGMVEGRPAALVYEGSETQTPAYFVLLDWAGGDLANIRDFRYARYATEGAEFTRLD